MEDFTMKQLKLRALTLKETSNGDNYLRCEFQTSKNKYAKTHAVNVFQNGSDATIFASLVQDFEMETLDELKLIECDEVFEGDIFTKDCTPHYIADADGNIVTRKEKNSKGKMVEIKAIAKTLTAIYIDTWDQTPEQVLNRFERQWEKQGLIIDEEDDEQ